MCRVCEHSLAFLETLASWEGEDRRAIRGGPVASALGPGSRLPFYPDVYCGHICICFPRIYKVMESRSPSYWSLVSALHAHHA